MFIGAWDSGLREARLPVGLERDIDRDGRIQLKEKDMYLLLDCAYGKHEIDDLTVLELESIFLMVTSF